MASRAVEIPADFGAALASEPAAQTFFSGLSNSLQRSHIDNINSVKAADTRQRRIEKAIALFLEHKPRLFLRDEAVDGLGNSAPE